MPKVDIRYSEENKGAQNLANTIGQQVCLW